MHVAQERSLFPLMTVWDNLLMGGHILRDRALVQRSRADAIAERFPLIGERRGERAGALSGGQQKLVEIARALMLEPRLVLIDEPSMGLDPKARHLIFEIVARAECGRAHDPARRAERARRPRDRRSTVPCSTAAASR